MIHTSWPHTFTLPAMTMSNIVGGSRTVIASEAERQPRAVAVVD